MNHNFSYTIDNIESHRELPPSHPDNLLDYLLRNPTEIPSPPTLRRNFNEFRNPVQGLANQRHPDNILSDRLARQAAQPSVGVTRRLQPFFENTINSNQNLSNILVPLEGHPDNLGDSSTDWIFRNAQPQVTNDPWDDMFGMLSSSR